MPAIPPPIVPDFVPGWTSMGTTPIEYIQQFNAPLLFNDGTPMYAELQLSPFHGGTNPAVETDGSDFVYEYGNVTDFQLKMSFMAMAQQLWNDIMDLGLARQPGTIAVVGNGGEWLVPHW